MTAPIRTGVGHGAYEQPRIVDEGKQPRVQPARGNWLDEKFVDTGVPGIDDPPRVGIADHHDQLHFGVTIALRDANTFDEGYCVDRSRHGIQNAEVRIELADDLFGRRGVCAFANLAYAQ